MGKLEIYEPSPCCPTGVCGPAPDPALAVLQENILRWKKKRVDLLIRKGKYPTDEQVVGEAR